MNTTLVQETARQTLAGTISFPEVVRALLAAGVEHYHVDFVNFRKTFCGIDGSFLVTPFELPALPPAAADFQASPLKAAILDSQRNGQSYPDFCRRAMAAGVQSYYAFLRGQRVTYLGRQGDAHIEWFPGAGPLARRMRGHGAAR